MSHRMHLSKKLSPKTPEKRDHMSKICYDSAIRSIMYEMICTKSDIDIVYAFSVTRIICPFKMSQMY